MSSYRLSINQLAEFSNATEASKPCLMYCLDIFSEGITSAPSIRTPHVEELKALCETLKSLW
ncbi:MAG: hypothetical protein JWQ09_3584 [Segetibacter sp.]|nr:hypothetical protein [Segetibacter sp.]